MSLFSRTQPETVRGRGPYPPPHPIISHIISFLVPSRPHPLNNFYMIARTYPVHILQFLWLWNNTQRLRNRRIITWCNLKYIPAWSLLWESLTDIPLPWPLWRNKPLPSNHLPNKSVEKKRNTVYRHGDCRDVMAPRPGSLDWWYTMVPSYFEKLNVFPTEICTHYTHYNYFKGKVRGPPSDVFQQRTAHNWILDSI